MKQSKTYHLFLPIVFLLLLATPLLNDTFHFAEFERNEENRSFTDSIEFNINNLDNFPQNFNHYVNDNIIFRKPFLDLFHHSKFYIFKTSPYPNKLIIGKDDWYFNAGKEKEIYTGLNYFSEVQLDSFTNEWEKRIQFIDSLNIKAYWIIAPMKHSIYSEKLPYNIVRKNENRTFQLKKRMNEDFPGLIIDPNSLLKKAKDSTQVFYKTDNHWNFSAGEIVAHQLFKLFKKEFPTKQFGKSPQIKWEKKIKKDGIQSRLLGVENISEEYFTPSASTNYISIEEKKYKFKGIESFAYNWEFEKCFINSKLTNGLRILIIRDSFGEQLIPFMRDSFEESLWIFDAWRYGLNKEIILEMKPDIILFVGLETHTDNILKHIE